MQALLAFFTRYFHWLVFILLEVASGAMLFRYNSYQNSVWLSSANIVSGQVHEWTSAVSQFFALKRLNEELTQRNIVLEQRLTRLSEQTDTAATTLPGEWSETQLLPAKVVANTINRPDNLMTINRGAADGVRPDMGVVGGNGVVGVVYMTSQRYSVVIPVLNRQSRISCSIRGRDYFGYLRWDGGDPLYAYLEDIPRHAKFKKGEWVETSGFSYIFPPGISVGRIVGIYDSADGLSYRLKVHLATDFACLRDVSVINDPDMAERIQLSRAAEDSIKVGTGE